MYEHEHNKTMSSGAIAAMLSTMLYYKRFFPYYVYNIVGGLDEEGNSTLYLSGEKKKKKRISILKWTSISAYLLSLIFFWSPFLITFFVGGGGYFTKFSGAGFSHKKIFFNTIGSRIL